MKVSPETNRRAYLSRRPLIYSMHQLFAHEKLKSNISPPSNRVNKDVTDRVTEKCSLIPKPIVQSLLFRSSSKMFRGRCGHNRMVVYNYMCNQCLSPLKVVSSNPVYGEVYSIQRYVI